MPRTPEQRAIKMAEIEANRPIPVDISDILLRLKSIEDDIQKFKTYLGIDK